MTSAEFVKNLQTLFGARLEGKSWKEAGIPIHHGRDYHSCGENDWTPTTRPMIQEAIDEAIRNAGYDSAKWLVQYSYDESDRRSANVAREDNIVTNFVVKQVFRKVDTPEDYFYAYSTYGERQGVYKVER